MGKRSDFARKPRDFYPTPPAAVAPLVPHLDWNARIWEPCAGNFALAAELERLGFTVMGACDIAPMDTRVDRADALETDAPRACDVIVTNPPWARAVLHAMIARFAAQRPTWLLFDADWVHTKQAAPYLPRLRKIVSVGRVRWIEGSAHDGFDNCAWHLFSSFSCAAPPEFHGRAE